MSWKCNLCETMNEDDLYMCEVCNAPSPYISFFDYEKVYVNQLSTLRWKADESEKVELIINGRWEDVTRLSRYTLNIFEGIEVKFRLTSNVSTRYFLKKIIPLPPCINDFCCEPKLLGYIGDKINFTWNVVGATKIAINGREVKSSTEERTLTPGLNTFVIRASNEFNSSEKAISVTAYEQPRIELKASKDKLRSGTGEKCTIKWHVNNAQSVQLHCDSISEDVGADGELTVIPVSTTCYSICAVGQEGKRIFKESIVVRVLDDAKVEFYSNKMKIMSGQHVYLKWNVTDAAKVELVGYGDVSFNSRRKIQPTNSTDYKLRVTDLFGGEKEYICNIEVFPLPVIKFNTSKEKLNRDKNERTQISWNVDKASRVLLNLDGSYKNAEVSGSSELSLQVTSTIKIKAIGLDGITEYKKELTIDVFNQAGITFKSDREYTLPDVPITLSWNVTHAKEVQLEGYGRVEPVGCKSVKIDEAKTFTLKVEDEFGITQKDVYVKMLPLPTINIINVPCPDLNETLNVAINIPAMAPLKTCFPILKMPTLWIEIPRENEDKMRAFFANTATLEKSMGLLDNIKNLFNHYFGKFSNGK